MCKQKRFTIRTSLTTLIVLLCSSIFAQQNLTVTGKISDSLSKSGLAVASITLKGNSKAGTTTDANGNFKITVPNNAVLVISSLNYAAKEIPVQNRSFLNILLSQRSSELNEVVVIGYGERKKKDVTGAISTVSSKDIEKSTAISPEMALQGKAAGVFVESGGGDPQARPLVRIRGVNTFGYAEPLYVVDGIPIYEGGAGATDGAIGDIRSPVNIFSMINPQDIESITVLKDASAAAIYGVRASNGVVLITTKRGKSGRPKVEFTTSYGVQNIPKTFSFLNTKQYFSLVNEAYNNNPDIDNGVPVPAGVKFGSFYDPASSQYAGNSRTYDWQKQLLNKDAPIQDYSVRVSGGNDAFNYYFSGGYAKQESPLKSNFLERYSIAANIESKVSKIIQTGLTIRLVQENSLVNTQSDLGTMAATIPFQPFFDPNDPTGFAPVTSGSFVANPDYNPDLLNAGAPLVFAPDDPKSLWGPQSRFNVFAFQALNNTKYDLLRVLGSAFVQIEPVKGFRIKGTLGGDYFINLKREWADVDNWRFSQTPGNPYSGQDGKAAGRYGERQGKTYNLNKELTLNYNHTFATDHNIDIVLSASDQFARWYVNDLSGNVDYADPLYRGIANKPPYTQGFAGILQEDALIGYVGRISYKYKDKYYLDGTLRYDGSSRLAPGHRWDQFPSFAAAWRISGEKFFPKVSFINDLKIRGGWGKLGNFQSAPFYAYLSGVSTSPDYPLGSGNGNGFGTQTQGAALPNFANTSLSWEKLKTTNIGLDAQLFNNKVSFTAEYYNKITYNIIQIVSLPPNTGIEAPAALNIAQVRNRGFEFQVSYNQRVGRVNLNISTNLTTVDNKVLKLNEGTPLGGEGGRIEEGYSMFYLWGYKEGGIFQSQAEIDAWRKSHADVSIGQSLTNPTAGYTYKPGDMYFQDVYGNPVNPKDRYSKNPDSLINSNDRTFLGKTIPGYYYGFTLNANYKGIDISVFFQGTGDVKKYNYARSGGESMGGLANQWATVLDRWTEQNHSTTIPRAVYNNPSNPNRLSSRFVESAAYLRLKNLQIGYSLPKSLLNKSGFIDNIRIYGSAINLFTVTKWTGLDPENDFIPPTRQFLIGINASF
ncbi:MAG: TonB-dependent receptor [Ginsengibacter sp.]